MEGVKRKERNCLQPTHNCHRLYLNLFDTSRVDVSKYKIKWERKELLKQLKGDFRLLSAFSETWKNEWKECPGDDEDNWREPKNRDCYGLMLLLMVLSSWRGWEDGVWTRSGVVRMAKWWWITREGRNGRNGRHSKKRKKVNLASGW